MIYDGPDSDLNKNRRRSSKGYYGYMPGKGAQNNNPMDEIYEEVHEDRSKAMGIMAFDLTREQANMFREKMGKESGKIWWRDITVRCLCEKCLLRR